MRPPSCRRPRDRSVDASGRSVRAAQYVRMSTEHQKYSTENQAEAMQRYAARRGIEIVRTYADAGKSGLRLDGQFDEHVAPCLDPAVIGIGFRRERPGIHGSTTVSRRAQHRSRAITQRSRALRRSG